MTSVRLGFVSVAMTLLLAGAVQAARGEAGAALPAAVESRPASKKSVSPQPVAAPVVELYTTTWCGYCRLAREYFHAREVPFTEYDVEKDADAARRFRALNPAGGIPLAVIDGRPILGFNKDAYEQSLGAR